MRLIDADALAYEILSEYGADGGTEDVNTIYGMIINAPTIEAEPQRHGEWETRKGIEYCSECNKSMIWQSNFCPNCGAKMDGGKDER